MAWAKLDDRFFTNPKVMRAGRDARDLYLVGLTYCAAELTDGFIPDEALPHIAVTADVTLLPIYRELAERLVSVGLWERVDGGYSVHDYLHFNLRAEAVKAERAASNKRVQEWRAARKGRNANGNGVTSAFGNGGGNADVTGKVHPSQSRPESFTPPNGGVAPGKPDAPPEEPWKAPLIEAFTAIGMPVPAINAVEGNHAKTLCRRYGPEVVAECWQAVATGEYGDPNGWDQRKLSFAHLNHAQFLANYVNTKNGTFKPPQRKGPQSSVTKALNVVNSNRTARAQAHLEGRNHRALTGT